MRNDIRIAADALGITLWRNNSGVAMRDTRPVRFGLGNDSEKLNRVMKSSDWIGISSLGHFVALEEKPLGWTFKGTEREIAQQAFHIHVRRNHGIAGFVTCAQDVYQLCAGRL